MKDLLSSDYPRWEGLRTVQAFRIGQISHAPDGAALSPSDLKYASVLVSPDWMARNRPVAGGYYVIDESGHTGFVRGDEFEKAYGQPCGQQ